MRFQDVPQKGLRGKVAASRNRFGPYQKAFVPPNQPGTPAQRAVRGNMAELSWLWNELGMFRANALTPAWKCPRDSMKKGEQSRESRDLHWRSPNGTRQTPDLLTYPNFSIA